MTSATTTTRIAIASIVASLGLLLAAPSVVLADTTTTTTVPETTTTEAPTTTLAPTTTTTAPATTTTTRPERTTTSTSEETTTSTTMPEKSSSSSKVWAWVLGGIAVLALIVAAIAGLVGASRRRQAGAAWVPSARAALETALLARSMLVSQPTGGDSQLAAVRAQGEDAARSLDRVAEQAPDEASRQVASSAAEGLRGVLFSLEAEHLLRSGPTAPSADQLAEADLSRRRRAAELDASLAQLDQATRPPER